MIDTITYGLTKDLPNGPIMRPEDPPIFDSIEVSDNRPETRGRIIGGVISFALLVATGAYLAFAI